MYQQYWSLPLSRAPPLQPSLAAPWRFWGLGCYHPLSNGVGASLKVSPLGLAMLSTSPQLKNSLLELSCQGGRCQFLPPVA